MQTTVGQILANAPLPKHLQDYSRVLDKKGMAALADKLADEGNPELFRKVMHGLFNAGQMASHYDGSSFSIRDLRTPPRTKAKLERLRAGVNMIVENQKLTTEQRESSIIELVRSQTKDLEDSLYNEALEMGNPFALQVLSGSRGKRGDLRSLLLGDLLVEDHKHRTIPVPVLNSFSSGVDPAEYWAGAYGARLGTISTKMMTAKAGFLAKQLSQAAHRQVVTENDCRTDRGIPVPASDSDNVGTVLATGAGDFDAGTILDTRNIRALGKKTISVRSPLTCEARRGVCGRCVGVRERGAFPEIGDNVGITASQALTEQISQTQLSAKHSGGRADTRVAQQSLEGFDLINQLVQVPKTFRDAAAISKVDGVVTSVGEAPQGGSLITIGDEQHFVPPDFEVQVKPGDRVEEGDVLSEGLPNPQELVRHRGIGEGRLAFVELFRKALNDSGMRANRRNIELITRGLVNHVKVTELDGPNNSLPDDILEYTTLERKYEPRYGFRVGTPQVARGKFLERPALHYSIGTRMTPKVVKKLADSGIKQVTYHDDEPSFQPHMVRAMENVAMSPDWQVRLGGSYLQRSLMDSLHRSRDSQVSGTSYIPGLVRSTEFGKKLRTEGVY